MVLGWVEAAASARRPATLWVEARRFRGETLNTILTSKYIFKSWSMISRVFSGFPFRLCALPAAKSASPLKPKIGAKIAKFATRQIWELLRLRPCNRSSAVGALGPRRGAGGPVVLRPCLKRVVPGSVPPWRALFCVAVSWSGRTFFRGSAMVFCFQPLETWDFF